MASSKGYEIGVLLDSLANACRQLGELKPGNPTERQRIKAEIKKYDDLVVQYLDAYSHSMKTSLKRKGTLNLYDLIH